MQQNNFEQFVIYLFCFDASWIGVWLWKIHKKYFFKNQPKWVLLKRVKTSQTIFT